ncbi:MAG: hypothetical protein ACLQPD_18540 [Desulfomonilaceae bacterium]
MQGKFKIWTMALACGALAVIVTHPAIAQTTSTSGTQEELT